MTKLVNDRRIGIPVCILVLLAVAWILSGCETTQIRYEPSDLDFIDDRPITMTTTTIHHTEKVSPGRYLSPIRTVPEPPYMKDRVAY